MRLFIYTETRDKLAKKSKEGGGFESIEIMVTDDLGVPSGNAQKQWVELYEKKETVPSESLPQPVKKIGKYPVYEY